MLDRTELSRVLAIHTGKGGAKKTSIATNVAGIIAAAQQPRVLLVDLDRQGNCGEDLGYTDRADDGLGLRKALESGDALQPTLSARTNLDVIAGGPELDGLTVQAGQNPFDMLASCLAPIADNYELIILDTPPGGTSTVDMALGAARYLIVPSPPDRSSIKGLEFVDRAVNTARMDNPMLTLLGTILVEVPTSATRIRAEAMDALEQTLGDPGLLFRTSLRWAPKPALAGRRLGLLAHEMAAAQQGNAPVEFLQNWQRMNDGSPSAPGLASDYFEITDEILLRINQEETRLAEQEEQQ